MAILILQEDGVYRIATRDGIEVVEPENNNSGSKISLRLTKDLSDFEINITHSPLYGLKVSKDGDDQIITIYSPFHSAHKH